MKLRDHKRKVGNLNSTIVLQKMEIDRLNGEVAQFKAAAEFMTGKVVTLTLEREQLRGALREYEILYGVPGGKMPVGVIKTTK